MIPETRSAIMDYLLRSNGYLLLEPTPDTAGVTGPLIGCTCAREP